jgi:hypothetical protein
VLENLRGRVRYDDPKTQRIKMVLPLVNPKRGNVIANRAFGVFGGKGGPAHQKGRGQCSDSEVTSIESHGLHLGFFYRDAAFQRGKVKPVCQIKWSQTGDDVAISPRRAKIAEVTAM